MKTIQVRLSDEEEASLQERVKLTGLTVSQLVRASLFPGKGEKNAQLPACAGQVEEVSRRVALLAEAVDRVAVESGRMSAACQAVAERLSEPPEVVERDCLAEVEREIGVLSRNMAKLLLAAQEQKGRPFGLDLPFVQATLMAAFSLARGSFAQSPERWEPFKDEAWRRAFDREEAGK